ncbi:Hpt domain-containing protein, partial [Kaarinaea lacus]
MSQQQASPGQEIDLHIIEEFIAEYNESHSDIEALLLRLENHTDDNSLLNELFRKVHNIKGNAQLIGLELIASFVHSLENILDRLRKRDLLFDKTLGDAILHAVDHIGTLCGNILNQHPTNNELTLHIQKELSQLATAEQNQVNNICQRIRQIFDGNETLPLVDDSQRLYTSATVNLVSQQ